MQKRYCLLVACLLSFSTMLFSQTWVRCSTGLPQDTAVLSLAKIDNVLFAGTEKAGVYKSIDDGNNWTHTPGNFYFNITQTWSMTTIDTFLFAGQRGSGVLKTSLHGNVWTVMNNGIGSGNKMIQDIISVGRTLYAASYGGGTHGGIFVFTDTANSWSFLYNNLGLDDKKVLSLASNSTYLFCGTAGINTAMPDTGVAFVTPLVGGTVWTVIDSGFVRNGIHLEAVSAMVANDTLVFAGTDDVEIHRSTNDGLLWAQQPGLNGDIFAIKIVGNQVFYGITWGGVYTSNDYGLNFTANNVGLSYNSISIPY